MLLKLLLLSFCYLIVAPSNEHLVAVVSPSSSDLVHIKAPLRALDIPPNPDLDSITVTQRSETGALEFSERAANSNPQQEKFFTDTKRAKVIENWKNNQDGLKSIYQDSMELKRLKVKMEDMINYWTKIGPKILFPPSKKITQAQEALDELEEGIVHFKTLRLLELGGIDLPNSRSQLIDSLSSKDPQLHSGLIKLPQEIVELTIGKTWSSLAESMVNDLRTRVLTNELFLYHDSSENLAAPFHRALLEWWKRALSTIDFLFKNHFVDQNVVRNFFLGPEMSQNLLRYIELRFSYDINHSILGGSLDFFEHWYWPMLHDSFKTFTEQDIKVLKNYLLLDFRYNKLKKWVEIAIRLPKAREDWLSFLLEFDNMKYLRSSGIPDGSKYPTASSSNEQISQTLNSQALQDSIKSDVKEIIKLISTLELQSTQTTRPSEIIWAEYLVDVLDFIERDISPKGLVKHILQEDANRFEFDSRINLIRLGAKVKSLEFNIRQHLHYLSIQKRRKNNVSDSSIFYLKKLYSNQLNELIDQYQLEFQELQVTLNTDTSRFHAIIRNNVKSTQNFIEYIDTRFAILSSMKASRN